MFEISLLMHNFDITLTFEIQVYKGKDKENVINDGIIRTSIWVEGHRSIVPLPPHSLLNKLPYSRKDKLLITWLLEEGTNPTTNIFLKAYKSILINQHKSENFMR